MRRVQRIPIDYLESLLEKTAHLCIEESGWKKGIVASDSIGVETDRYEAVLKLNKKKRCLERVRRLIYIKYHIVAILDHLIILKARITNHRVADCRALKSMLKSFSALPGSVFNADKAFDTEYIFRRVRELPMKPNIKQREMLKGGKRLRHRIKALKEFDPGLYRYRGMIESIFGAEVSDNHNLYTRFRKSVNQER